jgi:trk system potassium uptake protein
VKALVIGCGRVGSAVAKELAADGWDVAAVDEREDALGRLGETWAGAFVVGHGMDSGVLREAGIEDADAVVVSTNGDNTNIVIAQVAKNRFGVQSVVVRILDPARSAFFASQGIHTICPTQTAIEQLTAAVRAEVAAEAPRA